MVMAPRAVSVGAQMSWVAQHWNSNWVDLSQESNHPEMTQVFCSVCVCVSCQSCTVWSLITAVCVCGWASVPCKETQPPKSSSPGSEALSSACLGWAPGGLSVSLFLSPHTHILCASCWCRLWTIHTETHGNITHLSNISQPRAY